MIQVKGHQPARLLLPLLLRSDGQNFGPQVGFFLAVVPQFAPEGKICTAMLTVMYPVFPIQLIITVLHL